MESLVSLHLLAGWIGILAGVVSGAVIGLFFHREDWMGGYGSYRRRLTRLGHVAFFGLGFLNFFYGLTLAHAHIAESGAYWASWGFLAGAVAMPLCCFLSAWRKPFRHLFPIPVVALGGGVIILLAHWRAPQIP